MKRIGVLTSGGDSPGMNACVRAVVRMASSVNIEVYGVRWGYQGLIDDVVEPMTTRSVAGIIQGGGTMLGTARSPAFHTSEGRARAAQVLREHEIEGLVVCGGDGSLRGANLLAREWGIPIVGTPCTIDNDMAGTDFTIGFSTAVNTAVDAIDRIRDTAFSLERLFFVEVMGRTRGFITLEVGLAGGAEGLILPERKTDIDAICKQVEDDFARGKKACIFVVAEGDQHGGAFRVAEQVGSATGLEYRVAILGHLQRGGKPSAEDRVLASILGAAAVEGLASDKHGTMAGIISGGVVYTPFGEVVSGAKSLNPNALRLFHPLAGTHPYL